MKGSLVAMIEALHIYSKKNTNIHIGLLVTSDEEKGGAHGTRIFLEKYHYKPKVVIVPDGGNDFDIAVEEKGVLSMELVAEGKNAHTARPWEGVNATHQLITVINQIIRLYPVGRKHDWQTTASVVAFESENKANNIVPALAKAKINIRYIKKDAPESIIKAIKKLSKKLTVTARVSGSAIAVPPDAKSIQVFRSCVKKQTGKMPKCIRYPSTCDARYFSDRSILAIITRPSGGGAHQDDEWVSVDGLSRFVRILVDFFERSSAQD
jgi:succinyl-diaminopimelate desuccinylase